jgi:DNA-binding transcriptional LysR family regulator
MIMTRRRLPPFAALRAFEAVGRTLHFTRAAGELGVTQAAISRQIKSLETDLSTSLVRRGPAGNALTPEGEILFEAVRQGLDRIADGVQEISPATDRRQLTVSVAPFFSAVWLTPRLSRFIRRYPTIDVRLHHAYERPDFLRDEVDLGINWGDGNWRGVVTERFLDGAMTPLCTPRAAAMLGAGAEARSLMDFPLYCEFQISDWIAWFAAAGHVVSSGELQATQIDDTHALIRAAIETDGVALMIRSVAGDLLDSGQLVQPFAQVADVGRHYFLGRSRYRRESTEARRFRHWLAAELKC